MIMTVQHFLSLMDLTSAELLAIVARAKAYRDGVATPLIFQHKAVALVLEKSSTRTRVSFETGITHFGGHPVFLNATDSQIGRGEPVADTARVLSSMVEMIIMRTSGHERIEQMAKFSSVPVINALSDYNHPCQQLADIQTFLAHFDTIEDHKVAWVGDGNNVCHSWINAARLLGFKLAIAVPQEHEPDAQLVKAAGDLVALTHDPVEAVTGASAVVTDTWASMGQEHEKAERMATFKGFGVDQALMSLARKDAIFMHCLPAYRGMEVTKDVIDGPQSVVWEEAENRLHAQKALMEFLIAKNSGRNYPLVDA